MIFRFLRRLLGRSGRAPSAPAAEGPPVAVASPGGAPGARVGASGPGDVGRAPRSSMLRPPPPPPSPRVAPPPPPPPPPQSDVTPPPPPPPEPQVQPDAPAPVPDHLPAMPEPEEASRAKKLRIRLMLSDGTVTEPTGDSELLDRLAYLADNLMRDEDRSRSE